MMAAMAWRMMMMTRMMMLMMMMTTMMMMVMMMIELERSRVLFHPNTSYVTSTSQFSSKGVL